MRRCTCLFIFLCPAEMIWISASVLCVCLCQCPQVAKSQRKHHPLQSGISGVQPSPSVSYQEGTWNHKGCNRDGNRAPIQLPGIWVIFQRESHKTTKANLIRCSEAVSICPCFAGVWKCFCIYSPAFCEAKCKPSAKQCAKEMAMNANVAETDGHSLSSLSALLSTQSLTVVVQNNGIPFTNSPCLFCFSKEL